MNDVFRLVFCLFMLAAPAFAGANLASVSVLDEDPEGLVISCDLSADLSVVDRNGFQFTQAVFPNEGFVAREGLPDLPAITRVIIAPANSDIELEILSDERVEVDLSHPILPFQTDDHSKTDYDYTVIDDNLFPKNIVEIGEDQNFRGYRLVPITLYPFQFDPVNNQIIKHENIQISLNFTAINAEINSDATPRTLSKDTYRFLKALTLNHPHRDDNGEQLPRGGYLIVCQLSENQAEEHVSRLADWKRACGHHVEVVYGYNNWHNVGDNEIRERYEEWDPPLEYTCTIGTYQERQGIRDIAYGCLDGNNDHVPEVAVTRLGAMSESQLEVVVTRALSYQKNPWLEEMDWFDRAGAFANNVGRSHTPAVDYTIAWIHELEKRVGFPDAEYSSALGGRGNVASWLEDGLNIHFERGVSRSPMPNFNNLEFNPMWIAVGGGHVPRLVDQIWENGWPNSPIGPSVMTGTGHNPRTIDCNVLCGGMARGLLIERLPLGWSQSLAMLMLDYAGLNSWYQFAEEYRVLGEPGQRAWIGRPKEVEADYENITAGQNRFDIYVYDPQAEAGIANAFVSLTQPGELIAWGYTDETGLCVLELEDDLEDDVIVTVTGDGLLPLQNEVEVFEDNLFVSAFISDLNDEENGNGDGILNPGETAEITITLENLSENEDAENLTGELRAGSSWVAFDVAEFNLDRVASGDQVELEERINVTLSANAPENTDLDFSIIIRDDENNWISNLEVEVEGPALELEGVEGGVIFDAEVSDLDLTLINEGSLPSPATSAELVAISHWIQILNDASSYPAIEAGESAGLAGNPFRINPSPLAPPGLMAPMMVLLSVDENDVPDTVYFEIQIGEPRQNCPTGADDYGYLCFDDTDADWEQAPEFEWIEIDPQNRDRDFDGESIVDRRRDQFSVEIELPFTFIFYGVEYDAATVSENGFLAFGEDLQDLNQYENFPLDQVINGSLGMIAPYWDDLTLTQDSDICVFYNENEDYFIIQWQEISQPHGGGDLIFQVILFDPAHYPMVSGDGEILIQYLEIPNPNRGVDPPYYSTGICSPDGSTGINYVFGNEYPECSAEIENERALRFTTAVEVERGVIYGNVHDVASGEPMEGVVILTSFGQIAFTDENGDWDIPDAWGLPFDVTAMKQGWNDSTLTGFELTEEDTLEINFGLLHPTFDPTSWELSSYLDSNREIDLSFRINNNGNGPLDWTVDRRLLGDANAESWECRQNNMFGQMVEDNRINGVVFAGHHYYVSGANDGNPQIYVFSREGEYVRQFDQPERDNRGMRDLAYDGELIWGITDTDVYGITTDGEVIEHWRAAFNPTTTLAWDPDNEVFWMSGITTDIAAMTRDGQRADRPELERQDLRIYGLAYWPEDPDGYNLYILHKDRETNLQTLHKMNPENSDTAFVSQLIPDFGGRQSPEGAFITNELDVYSWVLISGCNSSPNEGGDRIDVWQIEGRKEWFKVYMDDEEELIEAHRGRIETMEFMDFILRLDSEALPETLFRSELFFTHNADSGVGHISIELNVVGPVPPTAFGLLEPSNGDTLESSIIDFSWEPSVDRNRDDEVRYELWIRNGGDIISTGLQIPSASVDLDTLWIDPNFQSPLKWWVTAYSGEDTVECNEHFEFLYKKPSSQDKEGVVPYEFGLKSVYPNPFNSSVTIKYGLDKLARSSLKIVDLMGKEIAALDERPMPAGNYAIVWDAGKVPSGMYLVLLESEQRTEYRKVILMR